MSKYQFGFIGCGNMGGALALAASEVIPHERLAICDADEQKTKPLTDAKKATAVDLSSVLNECEYIFLAIKPQGFSSLFEKIAPVLAKRKDSFVLVSMAAGISIADIETMLQKPCPIIRMMPNTPVAVGSGMILYCANGLTKEEMIDGYLEGLSKAGVLDRIPEKMIDAAGSLSGCGPAFVYLFAEALADGGVECGVPRDKAQLYAAQTLLGAAEMLLQTGKHPGALKDAVCSPGGTTIAGVHALENGAFRATVSNAVTAAFEKTAKLKK